jgi:hypothetical protein
MNMDMDSRRQTKFSFTNGWQVSVINDGYGAEKGFVEACVFSPDGTRVEDVLDDTGSDGSGIVGWLNDDDLVKLLVRVASLRPSSTWKEATK